MFSREKYLRMRKEDARKHVLVTGDTGVGKSTFLRQLMNYAQSCGDVCVVLDSKLEFIPEFYDAKRGDKILSPKDERCVYWDLGGEVTDEADAIAATRSMYPAEPGNAQGKWFDDQACAIAAWLLAYSTPRPSCAEFGYWLSHPEIIMEKVRGTEHEHTLDKNAANQRAGILGTMNKVGRALRMMPPPVDAGRREIFTIKQWAKERNGWLFLPNTADTRDALRPVQSGWADMALMRVMADKEQRKRVWFFFDELDSIGKLEKLAEGMGMMRSTGNPMVLGMQNPVQLEDRYGKTAKTIFSQAFTKVILAVSEGESAKHLETLIGEEERRYWRESRTDKRDQITISGPEDKRKPLVLASEIQGLPDLHGYFLQRPTDDEVGLHVVRIQMPYQTPIHHTQGLVERIIPKQDERPFQEATQPAVNGQLSFALPLATAQPKTSYVAPPMHWIANNSTVHNQQPDLPKPAAAAGKNPFGR